MRPRSLSLLLSAALFCARATGVVSRQPYLQSLTDSSVVVCWETARPCPGKAQYGLSAAYGQEAGARDSTYRHELRLAGLLSDTLYHYRVISAGDTSPDCTFRTPGPATTHLRFLVYGDNRSDSAAHHSVVARMESVEPAPRFILNVGDLTNDGTASQYQTFFNITRGLLGRAPLYSAIGNHDARNLGNWLATFALPGNERWYTFRYGSAAFLVVDTYSDIRPGSEQYRWLASTLKSQAADTTIRHSFVVLHEPPYTTNLAHMSNLGVRAHLCPLFERHGIDVVFAGHIHAYERSSVNGIQYVTSGGGGAPPAPDWGTAQPHTVYRETTLEFTVVEVSGDTVAIHSVRPDGTEFDSFQLVSPSR